MLNQATAQIILAQYKNTLEAFASMFEKNADKSVSEYVPNIIRGLESIGRGDKEFKPSLDSPPVNPVAYTLALIKDKQFIDLINQHCHENSPLRYKLNKFLHEDAFIRQILFYRSRTNMFAVKFPNQTFRDAFINNVDPGKLDIKTFDHLNKDTLFIEFNRRNNQQIHFANSQVMIDFIKYLNLNNSTLVTKTSNHFLTINDANILDKTKSISINLPADEEKCKQFKKESIADISKQLYSLTNDTNSFFSRLPADINIKIASLTRNDVDNSEQIARKAYQKN